jgi:hypothetical protein
VSIAAAQQPPAGAAGVRWSGASSGGPQQPPGSPGASRPPSRGSADAHARASFEAAAGTPGQQQQQQQQQQPAGGAPQQLRTSREGAAQRVRPGGPARALVSLITPPAHTQPPQPSHTQPPLAPQPHSGAGHRQAAAAAPPPRQAQVHFIGEIQGAEGFARRTLYCRWRLLHDGQAWELLNGRREGCTQVSGPQQPEDPLTVWAHPLDLQLGTHSIQVGGRASISARAGPGRAGPPPGRLGSAPAGGACAGSSARVAPARTTHAGRARLTTRPAPLRLPAARSAGRTCCCASTTARCTWGRTSSWATPSARCPPRRACTSSAAQPGAWRWQAPASRSASEVRARSTQPL